MAEFHLNGLVSGTDYQALIDKLVEIRRKPMVAKEEKNTRIEADVAAWSDINTYMTTLTDKLNDLRTWDTWNKMKATSSGLSKLTATATTAANVGSYKIGISQLAQAHSVRSNRASDLAPGGTNTTDLVAAGVLNAGDTFVIEGQTITIGATMSLNNLRDTINTASSSMPAANRVTASIVDNNLVITRNNTGSLQITMSDTGGTPLQALHILSAPATYEHELTVAQTAQFMVNSIAVERDNNTGLTDVVSGVTLNLTETTIADLTLTIDADRETPKKAIIAFIEAYNASAGILESYGDVALIGEASAKGASVDQSGILSSDSLVRMIKTNMRKQATLTEYPYLNQINASYTYGGNIGVMDSLDDIGIWTSSRSNRLEITDEDRLDYLLQNNFDTVSQLFRGVYDSTEGYVHGVATDFYKYSSSVSASLTGDIARRISALNDQKKGNESDMVEMQRDLDTYEQEMWNVFAKMEDAIASMQSELTGLTSQLGTNK